MRISDFELAHLGARWHMMAQESLSCNSNPSWEPRPSTETLIGAIFLKRFPLEGNCQNRSPLVPVVAGVLVKVWFDGEGRLLCD